MGERLEIVTPLHRRTARDYLGRMADGKVECMRRAREYGPDYWDGDRRFGYGGYRYDGRHAPVADALAARYGLRAGSRVLDVGCGRGFLLHELRARHGCEVAGLDVSAHALATAKEEVRPFLAPGRAEAPLPFDDKTFDLVISICALHNLRVFDLAAALGEIGRVGKRGFVVVESFRDERELFNLQCWALTCAAFFEPAEWEWLFGRFGYAGDYEFVFFE